MNAKDKLNEAIMEARANGLWPFKCWSCGDWFTEGRRRGKRKQGKHRIVCDDPVCILARIYWVRHGRWPISDPLRCRLARPPSALPVKLLYEVSEAA